MSRTFLIVVFSTCLALANVSHAQMQARAYAPEDLSGLSQPDRTRVIQNEYRDQSNGRQIANDQLRFYLDQINSGWRFSQIKQDIAVSLRGNGGWQPPSPPIGGSVLCESNDRRYRECRTPFRGQAMLQQTISGTSCVQGKTWGTQAGMVWVDKGCRARFTQAALPGPGSGAGYSVTCASNGHKHTTCAWNASYGTPHLLQNLSNTRCVQDRNWGYQHRNLWVSGGCRARFGVR